MSIPHIELAPGYAISRVILGGWQLAQGHGRRLAGRSDSNGILEAAMQTGVTTLDCADIYTGVEDLIGSFLSSARVDHAIRIHTKYVPDLDELPTLTAQQTAQTIERSLKRLGVECLDLVQFHWWDFDVPGYVEAAQTLHQLRQSGKIAHIGLTNFDAHHMAEILDAGVPVVSNQVQYSLLDRRPEGDLVRLCEEHGTALLCYGTLAGGFLSDAYRGAAEPTPPFENRSLIKYRLIIDEYGGWDRFQHLLLTLQSIADRHDTSIAAVASRFVLDQPQVAACITGIRTPQHLREIERVFRLRLESKDHAQVRSCLDESSGPEGPVYGLERVKGGRHASIMRMDLNRIGPSS